MTRKSLSENMAFLRRGKEDQEPCGLRIRRGAEKQGKKHWRQKRNECRDPKGRNTSGNGQEREGRHPWLGWRKERRRWELRSGAMGTGMPTGKLASCSRSPGGERVWWWLILCVNSTRPQGTRVGQILLWVCLWEYFWMRVTSELVNSVKQIALHCVGGSHPIS